MAESYSEPDIKTQVYSCFDSLDSIVDGMERVNSYNLSEILLNEKEVSLNDSDIVYVYSNQRVEGEKNYFNFWFWHSTFNN